MKRLWRRVVSAPVLIGAVGITLVACAHDDSTMFVYDVLAGTLSGTTCTFTPDPTQAFLPSGVLDVALASEYDATYLVANQMVAQADPTIPQTETSFIEINHANVRVTNTDGSLIREYSAVTAASIPPAAGTTPSFVPASVPTIDQQTVALIGAVATQSIVRVETFVQFFGKTTGGQSVESNVFQFPVDVCSGCLVSFPIAEDDQTSTVQPNCALAANANASTTTATAPCKFGQDSLVDCSLCKGNPACVTR